MSTFPFYPPTTAPPPPPKNQLNHFGLHYATILSLGFLLLLALILLSYICFRFSRRRQNPNPNFTDNGISLPRSIFVADEDEHEQNGVVGLDQAVINSYPKFPFVRGGCSSDCVCAICLCEYKDDEMLRMLLDCKHCFHLNCVDEWLKLNASCPVCRNSPLPTPLSTPLSEVVPLSLYADGRNRRR